MPVSDYDHMLRSSGNLTASELTPTGVEIGASPYQPIKVRVYVPAIDDAADTLDIHFEDSPDDSTYTDIEGGAMTQITGAGAAGTYEFVMPRWTGPYIRYAATVAGTTPDFGVVTIGFTPGQVATT